MVFCAPAGRTQPPRYVSSVRTYTYTYSMQHSPVSSYLKTLLSHSYYMYM